MSQETLGSIADQEILQAEIAEPEATRVREGIVGRIEDIATYGLLYFSEGTKINLDLPVAENLVEDVRGLVQDCIEEIRGN